MRANLKPISHGCHLFEVAFVWELTKETIHLPPGCLQGSSKPETRNKAEPEDAGEILFKRLPAVRGTAGKGSFNGSKGSTGNFNGSKGDVNGSKGATPKKGYSAPKTPGSPAVIIPHANVIEHLTKSIRMPGK